MSKPKPWHDRMVTIWVTPELRDHINSLRDPKKKIKTADDVIMMLIAYWELKEKK